MDRMKRLAATAALGAGVALTASVVTATAAQAAYTPTQICGSSYQVVESQPLGSNGEARVYWLNNGVSNCIVTLKQGSAIGNSVKVSATLKTGSATKVDGPAAFQYYAGPVKADNPGGACVSYGGTYGSSTYTSPASCG